MFQNDSLATLVDVTLANGVAYEGGGIYVDTDLVSLIDVTVIDSAAEKDGGGMFISDGAVDMEHVVFRNNTAFRGGGVHLHVHAGISSWSDVLFERNTSSGDGGAVSCVGGSAILIDGLDVLGNVAGGDGAGLYVSDCELPDTTRVVFADNVAGGYGGAVALVGTPHTQRFTHATFHGNQAFLGGAFFANGGNELYLDSVSFSENAALSNGDVFAGYLDGGDLVEVVASNISDSSYAVDFWNIQTGSSMDIEGFTNNAPEYVAAEAWDFCPSHTSPLVSASTATHDSHDHSCDIGGRFIDECWVITD
jgi:predicted outer membrane repeat protein